MEGQHKSESILVEAFGEKKTPKQWSRDIRCNIEYKTLWMRLKHGWSPEDAICKSSRTQHKVLSIVNPKILDLWTKRGNNPSTISSWSKDKLIEFYCPGCRCKMARKAYRLAKEIPVCFKCRGRKISEITKQRLAIAEPLSNYTQICSEFVADRNSLSPSQIHAGSVIKVWWRCSKCHNYWKVSPQQRTRRGDGCPKCHGDRISRTYQSRIPRERSLENSPILSELVGKDFFNLRNISFASKLKLFWKCSKCSHVYSASTHNRHRDKKTGCPSCKINTIKHANISRAAIRNPLSNHKNLCREFCNRLNLYSTSELAANSNIRVWWKCRSCKSEWMSSPNDRVHKGIGCLDCAKKRVAKKCMLLGAKRNPLSSFADLCKEFSVSLNVTPISEIAAKSNKKFWWECGKCKNVWLAKAADRTNGRGCPKCKESRLEKNTSKWLNVRHLQYKQEVRMKGMSYKKPLRFDFFLPLLNIAIECQGEQHYRPVRFTRKMTYKQALANLRSCQRRDRIKRRYCKRNSIRLIEIRYDESVEDRLREELAAILPKEKRRKSQAVAA